MLASYVCICLCGRELCLHLSVLTNNMFSIAVLASQNVHDYSISQVDELNHRLSRQANAYLRLWYIRVEGSSSLCIPVDGVYVCLHERYKITLYNYYNISLFSLMPGNIFEPDR